MKNLKEKNKLTLTEKRSLKRHINKVLRDLKPVIKEFLLNDIADMQNEKSAIKFVFGRSTQKSFSRLIVDHLINNRDQLKIEKVETATTYYAYFLYFTLRNNTLKVPIIIDKLTSQEDYEGFHSAMKYSVWINDYVAEKIV